MTREIIAKEGDCQLSSDHRGGRRSTLGRCAVAVGSTYPRKLLLPPELAIPHRHISAISRASRSPVYNQFSDCTGQRHVLLEIEVALALLKLLIFKTAVVAMPV
jgi:hypothetical protein